jgi:class 3 adenylate cyclase
MNINQIANNPLSSKEHFFVRKNHSDVTYETDFIEEAILKTGVLLALGLGEAGASSISKNISNDGDLVATMPGKKTFAIFGFCDIRNFTDSTEILQEEVMVFVNSIAEVVHGMVDKYGGSANKNIGDAFLMVWKFPKNEIITNEEGNLTLKKGRVVKNVTDLALISFLKIICALNNMPRFLKYRLHPGLNSRIANYQIKMGFGLHLGWAIEGTIGSEYKIDASYLSPNVNMAARLEAATKQYKSLLLVSNDFMEYTSKETRRYCREIDRVTVKGSIKPVGLFTVDMDLSNLVIAEPLAKDKRASFVERKSLMERIENLSEKMHELLDIDRDLVVALKVCKGQFKDAFDQGFLKYIAGDWKEAKEILEKCLLMRPNDGPSGVLMSVMGEEGFEPKNWQGYRVLTDK